MEDRFSEKDKEFLREDWRAGTIGSMESALTAQNDQLRHMAKRMKNLEYDLEHGSKNTVENFTIYRSRIIRLERDLAGVVTEQGLLRSHHHDDEYEHDPTLMEDCPCAEKHEHLIKGHQYPIECPINCIEHKDAFEDREDLINVLKVALKGLKPDATGTQMDIAYYAVRGKLSNE